MLGLIAAYADDLPAACAAAQFDFNGRVIAGRREDQSRWKRTVAAPNKRSASRSASCTSSGIAVALRAYRMSLKDKAAPVVGGFTGDQRFFLGYAQVWRFKARDEALRNQLLTDVHSPGMFRAFVPLTNIDAFYDAFNLKPGDTLYRPPAERVKIW